MFSYVYYLKCYYYNANIRIIYNICNNLNCLVRSLIALKVNLPLSL
nr:MAG TPA: hypothetical protein [Caudoviricetes sp.]